MGPACSYPRFEGTVGFPAISAGLERFGVLSHVAPLKGGTSLPPQGEDDFSLMEKIALGDRSAMDLLYRRYSPVVFSICMRIVGDQGIAEDLLIDVFFELWRKGERYDPARGAPLTYITTLARSRAIDRKRGKGGRWNTGAEGAIERMADAGFGEDPAPTPPQSSMLNEQAGAVRKALSHLEEDHRETLELSYFEGLSHSQIATKLGKPLGTVKTHIRMGIIRMRELLRMEPSRD